MPVSPYSYIIAALLCVACGNSRPSSVLAPAEMALVLKEFHLSDAVADKYQGKPETRDSLRKVVHAAVLTRAGVEPKAFYASYQWYVAHPVEMDSLYAGVLRLLNQQMPEEQQKEVQQKAAKANTAK